MELRHLRYFVAMAETGSLMKASERLHVAQPALSVHLANLEAELGVTLVTRSRRGVELTEHGEFLYTRALDMLRYHQDSISGLKARRSKPHGRVTVGLVSTLPPLLVPDLLRAVKAQLPDVTLYIVDASTSALYEWLTDGRIDMVVLFNLPEAPELEIIPVFSDHFYLCGKPGANTDTHIEFEDLVDLPLALPSVSTTWRQALEEAAERRGVTFAPVIETESSQTLRLLASLGECHAVLPGSGVYHDVQAGRLQARRVVNPDMAGMMSVARLASKPLTGAQTQVREILVEVARKVGRDMDLTVEPPPPLIRRTTPTLLFPIEGGKRWSGKES